MPAKGGLGKLLGKVLLAGAKKHVIKKDKNKNKRKIHRGKGKEEEVEEEEDDDENKVEHIRPSTNLKSRIRIPVDAPPGPPLPIELPCLFRVFKGTFQMVNLDLMVLKSQAAFVMICDEDRRVVNWVGNDCDENDLEEADKIGLTVLKREYGQTSLMEAPTIYEDSESDTQKLFLYFLDHLSGGKESTYYSKKVKFARTENCVNSRVYVSTISKSATTLTPKFHEKGAYEPDDEGYISRVEFPQVHLSTIVTINIGDIWYMWITRGVSAQDEYAAKHLLISEVRKRLGDATNTGGILGDLGDMAFGNQPSDQVDDDGLIGKSIRIIRQGAERTTFRRFFKIFTEYEPRDKTAPHVAGNTAQAVEEVGSFESAAESIISDKGFVPGLYDTLGITLLLPGLTAPNFNTAAAAAAASNGFDLLDAGNAVDPLPASIGKRADDRILESLRWLSSDVDSKSQSQSQFQSESALSSGVESASLSKQAQLGGSALDNDDDIDMKAFNRQGSNVSEALGMSAAGLVRTGSANSAGSFRRSGSISGRPAGGRGSKRSGSDNGSASGDKDGAPLVAQRSNTGLKKSGSVASNTSRLSQRMNSERAENEKSTKVDGFFGLKVKNAGRDLIEAGDLELLEFDNIAPQSRIEIIAKAEKNPNSLVGWQIEIDDGPLAGIQVITGIKKTFGGPRRFRLTSYTQPDTWVVLRRGKKDGLPFRPLRNLGWS